MSATQDTQNERTKTNKNRANLTKRLNIPAQNLILAKQPHNNKVAIIDSKNAARNKSHLSGQGIPDIDALVTTLPNICIAVRTSDCVPIVFYDPENKVIAVAHSGWQGTVKKIAINTVETMRSLGAKPESIVAVIGPSIGPCHFEISSNPANNVIQKVKKAFPTTHTSLLSKWHENNTKAYFDLWKSNQELLISAGLRINNIEISGLCTACKNDQFYSWRKEHLSQSFITGIVRYR